MQISLAFVELVSNQEGHVARTLSVLAINLALSRSEGQETGSKRLPSLHGGAIQHKFLAFWSEERGTELFYLLLSLSYLFPF